MSIKVQNRQRKLPLDSKRWNAWASRLHRAAGWTEEEVTIRIVSAQALRSMNRRFRGEDNFTDVLAFSAEVPAGFDSPRFLGDIAVSIEAVREQAKVYGHSEEEELKLLMAHGVAHLMGYGDSTARERRRIRHVERKLIQAADMAEEED